MGAERSLADLAVGGAIEEATPTLEFVDPLGRLARMQFRHAPVVDQLAAPHRVMEVDAPVVLRVQVAKRRGDPALGHNRMRLAQQRLTDDRDVGPHRRSFDSGAKASTSGPNHQDVVAVDAIRFSHGSGRGHEGAGDQWRDGV
jgi:hypothetical protein